MSRWQKAVRNNRVYGDRLHWRQHYDRMATHLGFRRTPDESQFAEAVDRWQRGRPSGAILDTDGILGPRSWFVMALEIGLPWLNLDLVKELNLQYQQTEGWGAYQGRIVGSLPHLNYSPDIRVRSEARDFAIAVGWWQLDNPPLAMDGILGPNTWRAMRNAGIVRPGPRVTPTFSSMVRNYPNSPNAVGSGGTIINNPAYEGVTCAVRLSIALEGADPGIMYNFPGTRAIHITPLGRRVRHPYAINALALNNYLKGGRIGWPSRRIASRAAALRLSQRGVIFWKVIPKPDQQPFVDAGLIRRPWPGHIDQWDPVTRSLSGQRGTTMRWFPIEQIVDHVRFFPLPLGFAQSYDGDPDPFFGGSTTR